jgi:mRNA interferase MazF
LTVNANKETGLRSASQIMVDKATTVPRSKVGPRIGRLNAATMQAVNHALRDFLDL